MVEKMKPSEQLYNVLIDDNYDINSIGRNLQEFEDKLANDTVFSNFAYDYMRTRADYKGTKAEFMVKALGDKAVSSAVSRGKKTVVPYKPNKNEYVLRDRKSVV